MKLKSYWLIVICLLTVLIALWLVGATKAGYINNYLNIEFLKPSESKTKNVIEKNVIENNNEAITAKKKSMDATKCPFPISDYNNLSQGEKNKLSMSLTGFMNSVSVQKEKCSDYFSIIEPLLSKGEDVGKISYLFNSNEIRFFVQAFSKRLVTATSTPPTFFHGYPAIKGPTSFGSKEEMYAFYYLNLNLSEFIELIKNNEIASIDFMFPVSNHSELF